MMMKKILLTIAAISAVTFSYATTLDNVKSNGKLACGVNVGANGFAVPDDHNNWIGFDVDFCRAVASAIFNDPKKVKFVPLSAKERFTALQSGEIDVLSRTTTNTMRRDAGLGLNFIGTVYYDGQGFMVRKALGVKNALGLSGASVCTNTGTTTELNIADFFKSNNMQYKPIVFDKINEAVSAYDAGRCDVISTDISALESYRVILKNPDKHIVLPNIISKEPLAPAVRQGDDQWLDLVAWTRNCQINAEELGINSNNVEQMKKSNNPRIKRLLGVDGNFGQLIGLNKSWCTNIITHVGNYGKMYDRNLGKKSKVTIARGLNRLWNKGGIMYAPPIR